MYGTKKELIAELEKFPDDYILMLPLWSECDIISVINGNEEDLEDAIDPEKNSGHRIAKKFHLMNEQEQKAILLDIAKRCIEYHDSEVGINWEVIFLHSEAALGIEE